MRGEEKMGTKVCSNCKESLEISYFFKDNSKKDNLRSSCKKCDKEGKSTRNWRLEYKRRNRNAISMTEFTESRRKYTLDSIRKLLQFENYSLLSTESYKNVHQKFKFKCPNGHISSFCMHSWNTGRRCYFCVGNRTLLYFNDKLDKFSKYKKVTIYLSNKNFNKYKPIIDQYNCGRNKKFHLDHIYSVLDGFKNEVLPQVIANPTNLRIIKSKDNLVKNSKSFISLYELYKNYNDFVTFIDPSITFLETHINP